MCIFVLGGDSFGISTVKGCALLGKAATSSLVVTWKDSLAGPASAPLVWFGWGQSAIVLLETTKSRLWPEPHPCTGVTD